MFSIPQMVLVTLWFTFYNLLTSGTGLGLVAGGVVLNGLVVGAIMGDISTGFYLGGTYELMNIGLNPLGGSTVPNYNMGVMGWCGIRRCGRCGNRHGRWHRGGYSRFHAGRSGKNGRLVLPA